MNTPPAPLCEYCRKPLPAYPWRDQPWATGAWGYHGDGVFCTLRCGYKWAIARTGMRFQK